MHKVAKLGAVLTACLQVELGAEVAAKKTPDSLSFDRCVQLIRKALVMKIENYIRIFLNQIRIVLKRFKRNQCIDKHIDTWWMNNNTVILSI